MTNIGRIKLKDVYTKADGLMANGKEPEFTDRIRVVKPDIAGILEAELTKGLETNSVFTGGCTSQ